MKQVAGYSKVLGKTRINLENELRVVYKEYSDEWESFDAMVGKFATDAFYHLHLVAKQLLLMKTFDPTPCSIHYLSMKED